MERVKWLLWGLLFSTVLFLALYFLIYRPINSAQEMPKLMLGSMDVSRIGVFFSKLSNVIISSLVVGISLGILTGSGSRKKVNIN